MKRGSLEQASVLPDQTVDGATILARTVTWNRELIKPQVALVRVSAQQQEWEPNSQRKVKGTIVPPKFQDICALPGVCTEVRGQPQ